MCIFQNLRKYCIFGLLYHSSFFMLSKETSSRSPIIIRKDKFQKLPISIDIWQLSKAIVFVYDKNKNCWYSDVRFTRHRLFLSRKRLQNLLCTILNSPLYFFLEHNHLITPSTRPLFCSLAICARHFLLLLYFVLYFSLGC